MLYVDGGGLLFGTPFLEGNPQADLLRERARVVARAQVAMGVAAVNVGRNDLTDGLPAMERLAKDPGVPWVSANLRRKGGDYPFPRWKIVTWGRSKVGIFGLLAPDAYRDERLGLEVDDPAEAARAALKALKAADAVVCLSNLGLAQELKLAAAVPGIALLVGGGSPELLGQPQVVGDTVVLHAGEKGKYLGVVDLETSSLGKAWSKPRDAQEQANLEARRTAYRAELAAFGGGTQAQLLARNGADPEKNRQIQSLFRGLAEAERGLAQLKEARVVFSHRIVTLDPSVGESAEVAAQVKAYKGREAAWLRDRAGGPARLPAAGTSQPPGPPSHQGSSACRSCHAAAFRAWLGTPHSRSFLALRGGKEQERQCLDCHATFLTRADGPQLEPDVACEACHGPGGNHRTAGNIARKPPEKLCRQCHRDFHKDERFEYDSAYEKVRCDRK